MKKTVYAILISSLIIGFCLIIMDELAKGKDGFNVPARFEKVIVDLSEQSGTNELLFTRELNVPSSVEFFIQSDSANEKSVKVVSESGILGMNGKEINFIVWKYTGNSSISGTYIMQPGKYSVYLTSGKANGKVAIGYRETEKELSEFERLYKIHKGDLNNPPKGYVEIFSTNLSGRSCKEEVIHTLSMDKTKNIGLSVYISSEEGTVCVDLIGKSSNFIGLVYSPHRRICDQLETTLSPGEYQLKLTCENADGQLYVFMKQ